MQGTRNKEKEKVRKRMGSSASTSKVIPKTLTIETKVPQEVKSNEEVDRKENDSNIENIENRRRVCVLYTGGTIGMKEDEKGRLECSAGYLEKEIESALSTMSRWEFTYRIFY